jgi:hypothetical protein
LEKFFFWDERLADPKILETLSGSLPSLNYLEIESTRRKLTYSSEEDYYKYNIIMPHISSKMISLTCFKQVYNSIIVAAKRFIGDVEMVQCFIYDDMMTDTFENALPMNMTALKECKVEIDQFHPFFIFVDLTRYWGGYKSIREIVFN